MEHVTLGRTELRVSKFGLGAGGYAVKKKRDAGKAQAERDETKTEATIQSQVAAAIEAAKIATAPTTADSPNG